jgi:hypothetical protein
LFNLQSPKIVARLWLWFGCTVAAISIFGRFRPFFDRHAFIRWKMSPNFGYVHVGAKIRVSVYNTPRQMVRVYEIHLFLPRFAGHIEVRISRRRAPCARWFLFRPASRESRLCIAHRVEVTADEVDYFLFFHLFISSYCLGKRIDFRSVEFLVFSPSRIYRSRRHSSGAALPRPTGQFQILWKTCDLCISEREWAPNERLRHACAKSTYAVDATACFPIHQVQWRNEPHPCSRLCIPSVFSKDQVHGSYMLCI